MRSVTFVFRSFDRGNLVIDGLTSGRIVTNENFIEVYDGDIFRASVNKIDIQYYTLENDEVPQAEPEVDTPQEPVVE